MFKIDIYSVNKGQKDKKLYSIKYPDITTVNAARYAILQLAGKTTNVPIDLTVAEHKKQKPQKEVNIPQYWVSKPIEVK